MVGKRSTRLTEALGTEWNPSGVRGQESGDRSQGTGVRGQESGDGGRWMAAKRRRRPRRSGRASVWSGVKSFGRYEQDEQDGDRPGFVGNPVYLVDPVVTTCGTAVPAVEG